MFISLVLVTAVVLSSPSPEPAATPEAPDWLVEDAAGILRLRLAHAEATRPDGGTLVVDPNRRVVEWQGAPGENGCRRALEVPFARVRALRAEPQGVLRLELRGEARGGWEFVPLPHAAWLTRTSSAIARGFLPDLRQTLVAGPADDAPMPASGSAAFMGAQVRADLVPPDVTADVRLAAERARKALGREALPSTAVYEALHGDPIEVALAELGPNAAVLEGRAVRVRGLVVDGPGGRLTLVDGDARVRAVPEPEIAALVRAASRGWAGEEVELTGVVRRTLGKDGAPDTGIAFWQFEGPESVAAPEGEARTVTVRALVENATALAGRVVRVVGKFRGRNLYGDLTGPAPRGAWVIKSRRHAVWVVGRRPAGRGFRLDPDLARDTTQWLEVTGVVETSDGAPRLRARSVALAPPQTFVWNGPRLRPDPHPDVVFTLPLADEAVSAREGRLLVQFSAYMDEETFAGRVRVFARRANAPERELAARLTYDDVRRTLIVDVGGRLPEGGVVEVRLLPGIEDVYGAVLARADVARADGTKADDAVRVLRWRVASTASADASP
ncbi:MAG: hypothetical protein U0599_02380 [Vicinamibacteria bacterium]